MRSTIAVSASSPVTLQSNHCSKDPVGDDKRRNMETEARTGSTEASGGCVEPSPKVSGSPNSSSIRDAEVLGTEDSFVPALASVLTHLVSLSPAERCQGASLLSLIRAFIASVHEVSRSHSGGRSTAAQSAPLAVDVNSTSDAVNEKVTRFHAVKAPDISIRDYLSRIQNYFGCSNECFVLALVYIDRIVKLNEGFTVSILNIHRLLITAVMLAAKFFDDVYYSNAFYARVGGVRTQEINLLEWQFLALVNYRLFVTPREYDQYRRNVLAALEAGIPHIFPEVATKERNSSATDSTCPSPSQSRNEGSLGPEEIIRQAATDAPSPATVSADQMCSAAPSKEEDKLTKQSGVDVDEVIGGCRRSGKENQSPAEIVCAAPTPVEQPEDVSSLSTGTVTIDQQKPRPEISIPGQGLRRQLTTDIESTTAASTTATTPTARSPLSYRDASANAADLSSRNRGQSPRAGGEDTYYMQQTLMTPAKCDSGRFSQRRVQMEQGTSSSSGSSIGGSARSAFVGRDSVESSAVPLFLVPAPRVEQTLSPFPYNNPTAAHRQFHSAQHLPSFTAQDLFSSPPLLYPRVQCSHYDSPYGRQYTGGGYSSGRYQRGGDNFSPCSHPPFCRDSSRRSVYWQDPVSRHHIGGSSRREPLYSNRYETLAYRPATALPHW